MDEDLSLPKNRQDALAILGAQDLDRLSVAELEQRIAALEAEISRTRARIQKAVNHIASAEGLFRK
ncbi:MAG: DUF1192 domain-containing protein [Sphingomonas fennica]